MASDEQRVQEAQQGRRIADSWRGKVETFAWFINKVGLGSTLAVFMLAIIGGILYLFLTGEVQIKIPDAVKTEQGIPSPLPSIRAEEMFKELNTTHLAQLKVQEQAFQISERQIKLIERQTATLNEISCRLEVNDKERIKCMKRAMLNGGKQD